jgi:glycosyltransferase involved in cell wall biosynthesis
MSNLIKGKATICIVNYKTLDFTRLCLRSIRKFTKYPNEVIVVDNDSQDASLEYLKSLNWIRLIERRAGADEPGGGYAHAVGLDLGLENCNTEFFVSMHSDTFVRKDNWLRDLISYFDGDGDVVCVGSGKIEMIPKWRILLKKATDLRTFKRKIFREPDPTGKFRYYNRTICSLYRTDILRRERLSFLMDRDKGLTGGKKLYFELVDRGYKTVELPPSVMRQFIYHLAHATQVVNPLEFALRKRTIRKCNRVVEKVMSSSLVQKILVDDLLDQ